MKKESVLNKLQQLADESEQKSIEELGSMPLRILLVLMDYINDSQIYDVVQKINF